MKRSLRTPLLVRNVTTTTTTATSWTVSQVATGVLLVVCAALLISFSVVSVVYGATALSWWPAQEAQIVQVNASLHTFDEEIIILQDNVTIMWDFYQEIALINMREMTGAYDHVTELYAFYAYALSHTITNVNGVYGNDVVIASDTLSISPLGPGVISVSGAGIEAELSGLAIETEILLQNALQTQTLLDGIQSESILDLGTNLIFTTTCGIGQTNNPGNHSVDFNACGVTFGADLDANCTVETLQLNQTVANISTTLIESLLNTTQTQLIILNNSVNALNASNRYITNINGVFPTTTDISVNLSCIDASCTWGVANGTDISLNAAGITSVNGETGPVVELGSVDDAVFSVFASSTNVTFVSFAYTTANTCVQTGAQLGIPGFASPPLQNTWQPVISTIPHCVGTCCEHAYFTTNTCGTDFQGCTPLGWRVFNIPSSILSRLLFTFPPYTNSMWNLKLEVALSFGVANTALRSTAITFGLGIDTACSSVPYAFGTSTTVFNTVNNNALSLWFNGGLTLVSAQVPALTQYTLCYLITGPSDPTNTVLSMQVFPTLVKIY